MNYEFYVMLFILATIFTILSYIVPRVPDMVLTTITSGILFIAIAMSSFGVELTQEATVTTIYSTVFAIVSCLIMLMQLVRLYTIITSLWSDYKREKSDSI